ADTFHLLRLNELFLRLQQLLLRLTLLGDVVRDLCKADELALAVEHRIDDHARPELRAVFADTKALCFELPITQSCLERFRGNAGCAVGIGVEGLEMPPENLGFRVALDALGARVPVSYVAGPVEHEDCVVGDVSHHELKASLGLLSL